MVLPPPPLPPLLYSACRQLDTQGPGEDDEVNGLKSGAKYDNYGAAVRRSTSPLPPLGPGIPLCLSPRGTSGFQPNDIGNDGHDSSKSGSSGMVGLYPSVSSIDNATGTLEQSLPDNASSGDGRSYASPGQRQREVVERPGAGGGASVAAAVEAMKNKKQSDRAAPLRFYLVRGGHNFVEVGRPREGRMWKELPVLPALPTSHGIPIVLDPSPYQVLCVGYIYVWISPLSYDP